MDAAPEQVEQFGAEARRLRTAKGLSVRAVAAYLTEHDEPTTHQNVSAWERAEYPPRTRRKIELLEELYEADGRLVPLLWTERTSLEDRLDAVEAAFAEIREENVSQREMLAQILRRLDGQGSGG